MTPSAESYRVKSIDPVGTAIDVRVASPEHGEGSQYLLLMDHVLFFLNGTAAGRDQVKAWFPTATHPKVEIVRMHDGDLWIDEARFSDSGR